MLGIDLGSNTLRAVQMDEKLNKLKEYEFCRRKNKISIWKNKTSIKVEILFFYKP
nr:hypothetical protein [Campylobacter jejuni]